MATPAALPPTLPGPSLVTFPRIVEIGDPSGFTLTRAQWQSTTPDILQAENTIQYGDSAALRQATESRIVGVVPDTLMELVNSRIEGREIADLQTTKVRGQEASIEPYKYRIRQRQHRMSYFNIYAGAADPLAGTTDTNGVYHPLSSWVISVNLGTGQYATQFLQLSRFFTPAGSLSIDWKNVTTLLQTRIVGQIIQSAGISPLDLGPVATQSNACSITISAPFTDAAWSAMSAAAQAPWLPTFGLVTPLANNISDWESYSTNAPTDIGTELLTDWVATTRRPIATNDLYLQGLKDIEAGMTNEVLKKFQSLPITQIVKQQMIYWDKVELNALFFSTRIDLNNQIDNPNRANILALPVVTEHQDGNILDRKANIVGIITQLEEQGRVLDFAGAPLNLNAVLPFLQVVRRNRQIDGKPHDVLDLMMDRFNKSKFDKVMLAYLRAGYGFGTEQFIGGENPVKGGSSLDQQGLIMFQWTTYDLPDQQMKVALIAHYYFEDRKSAFGLGTGGVQGNYNNQSLGNEIWCLDWPDITIGMIATNEVTRDFRNEITQQADPFYAQCMKVNTKHYRFQSNTRCVEFGDYQRHAIFRNFSNAQFILNYQAATGLVTS